MARWTWVLLATWMLCATSAHAMSFEALLARIKEATVTVTSYAEDGQKLQEATGFFLAPDQVVTSAISLPFAWRIELHTAHGEKLAVDGVLAADVDKGVAVVSVHRPQSVPPILPLSVRTPDDGEHVATVSGASTLEGTASDGIVSAVRDQEPFGQAIQFTAPTSRSSHGAPLVDTEGNVIGVVVASAQRGQNINFAVPAAVVKNFKLGPLVKLADWNRRTPVGQAADTLRIYLQALNARQYQSAWNFQSRHTQDEEVRISSDPQNGTGKSAETWRDILAGQGDDTETSRAWEVYRTRQKPWDHLNDTYSVESQHADKVVLALRSDPNQFPTYFVMVREDGTWKFDWVETIEYRNKHPHP